MKSILSGKNKYRLFLILLTISITSISILTVRKIYSMIPGRISLVKDEVKTIEFNLPLTGQVQSGEATTVSFSTPISFHANEVGEYKINVKLFGLFDLKTVTVNVFDEKQVIPCGMQVGIYMKTDGVLVVNTGNIVDSNGNSVSPCENKIKAGDYIVAINGQDISTKSQLSNLVNEYGADGVILSIRRNDEIVEVKIIPALDAANEYKIGLWVRDDAQGIGTLTYIDSKSNFGALGHGISDVDVAQTLQLEKGFLYKAKILSIVQGKSGEPGEFVGSIDYNSTNQIGIINKNCDCGIYGTVYSDIISEYNLKPMDIGYRYDVHKGKAYIRVCINNQIKDYEVEITNVNTADNVKTKNITLKVTDRELLDITGGVVQGMSGSPIIQDEKIVGAVTHVFVDNSTYGYGIFIENMLNQ